MNDLNFCMKPTPEQFTDWLQEAIRDGVTGKIGVVCAKIADRAYAAGADAELAACCKWVQENIPRLPHNTFPEDGLRAARRPPAPSRREQAIKALARQLGNPVGLNEIDREAMNLALEALQEEPNG